jgi:hypothetical protein
VTAARAYALQGVVFLLVGGTLLFTRDDRHIPEAIVTLIVVFSVSALGFGLALRERLSERATPRRPGSRRYPATASFDTASGEG